MTKYSANRRQFDFLTSEGSERYLIFLKDYVFRTNPKFLSVVESSELKTQDGPMFEILLVDEIENPSFDIVACCIVNGHPFLVWKDKVYTVAIDDSGVNCSHIRSANPCSEVSLEIPPNEPWSVIVHEVSGCVRDDDRLTKEESL